MEIIPPVVDRASADKLMAGFSWNYVQDFITNLSIISVFRANWLSDTHIMHSDVNESLASLFIFTDWYECNSLQKNFINVV
jgi:hypothetical protein